VDLDICYCRLWGGFRYRLLQVVGWIWIQVTAGGGVDLDIK
jgi:hypothetical protein